ncbi:YegP family protein [Cochleicola gelatinilyticus]|uniref:Uncharacterized protein n=1 Tax=Cochleicola gelatinilyticus TaxID=1763537 RepID=A0A167HNY4_9FLAO|nr:hypothetical protein [Cochleicola gelatinilyticus]OAB78810.1 hypothetical protein ULVI_09525 [Cochleicola gelatinilyticus]
MSTVTPYSTLSKNTATQDDLDFEFLRKKGIEYIEAMGSDLWSDYNSHDPGITILEVLCYAITDLGARIALPMEDLLAEEKTIDHLSKQFLTAEKALPVSPVSLLDYRKLCIDIDGVKNAWLKKHEKTVFVNCKDNELSYKPFPSIEKGYRKEFVINGLYDILIELDTLNSTQFNTAAKRKKEINRIKKEVRATYHAHRNLCEDLVGITEVTEHPVAICAQIELLPQADEEKVHAEVLRVVDEYLSPTLPFLSLKQMLDKGYTSDVIFNGPLLRNGFIEEEALQKSELRKEIRLSDLIQLLQEIEGIDVIRDITINNCDGTETAKKIWNLCVPANTKPTRCDKSSFSYYKGFLPLNISNQEVATYQRIADEARDKALIETALASKKLELPRGRFQDVGNYNSIQNDFPEVYGIGELGVKLPASEATRAKVKQLKGYLLFFDQIFATYFAHLNKVKELFSIQGTASESYVTQLVTDIKNGDELVSNAYSANEDVTKLLLSDLDDPVLRRNEILDHLLARFAENFSEYAFLMKQLYGSNKDAAVIRTKELFLQSYNMIGGERPRSFNYFEQEASALWDTGNVSAFEKRIALLTGNKNYFRRNFSDDPLEIYEEIDDDDIIEYRFRFRNEGDTILSSSSKHYHSLASLYAEILTVKNYGRFPENYEIKRDKNGKHFFNLTNPNVPDLKDEAHIIARKIKTYTSEAEAKTAIKEVAEFIRTLDSNEGMYVIEHILLRPDVTTIGAAKETFMPICAENCEEEACEGIDPYSFRVSIVLPGWTERYSNVDFRKFMEDLIQKELPAHILPKICWIGYPKSYDTKGEENEMVELEEAYKAWLELKTNKGQKQDTNALKRLNKIVSTLHTIYTQGKLHNCENDEEQQDIILGRTNLGKL